MSKRISLVLLAFAALTSATYAAVDVSSGDDVWINYSGLGESIHNGGPFHATIWNDDVFDLGANTTTKAQYLATNPGLAIVDSLVFCVERRDSQYVYLNDWMKEITAAGVQTLPGNYSVTGYAVFVYGRFITLYGDTFDEQRTALASLSATDRQDVLTAFQHAIWAGVIQGGVTGNMTIESTDIGGRYSQLGTDLTGTNLQTSTYTTLGIAPSQFSGSMAVNPNGSVRIFRMEDPSAQEQIFTFTVTGSPGVPEPATLLIWSVLGGAGASVVAARRRKGWSAEKRQAIRDVVSGHKA